MLCRLTVDLLWPGVRVRARAHVHVRMRVRVRVQANDVYQWFTHNFMRSNINSDTRWKDHLCQSLCQVG